MAEHEPDIGGLWINDMKNGTGKYMSGKIKIGGVETSIIIFRNTRKKEGEKYPDYRIFEQRPRDGAPSNSSAPQEPVDQDDIPF